MLKTINEYRGVILFLMAVLLMLSMLSSRVKELNAMDNSNASYYYENN